jgi:hypothetical protein
MAVNLTALKLLQAELHTVAYLISDCCAFKESVHWLFIILRPHVGCRLLITRGLWSLLNGSSSTPFLLGTFVASNIPVSSVNIRRMLEGRLGG